MPFYLFICLFIYWVKFKKIMFIYFERERQSMSWGGAEREEDRGSEAGSVLTAESPRWGSNSQTVRSGPEPMSDG